MARKRESKDVELATQEQMEQELTLEVVSASDVCKTDNLTRMGRAEDGGVWFKDTQSGLNYRVMMNTDGTCLVVETRESKKKKAKVKKTYAETRTTITCIEEGCGAVRDVATQDAHQVKRCVPCQKAFRARKRSERAKAVRAERRKEKELAGLNSKPKPEAVPA